MASENFYCYKRRRKEVYPILHFLLWHQKQWQTAIVFADNGWARGLARSLNAATRYTCRHLWDFCYSLPSLEVKPVLQISLQPLQRKTRSETGTSFSLADAHMLPCQGSRGQSEIMFSGSRPAKSCTRHRDREKEPKPRACQSMIHLPHPMYL